jgi:oligoribonuclease
VFLDLETCGLDPVNHPILEVGILALDDNLVEVNSFRQNVHFIAYKAGIPIPWIHPKVVEMHAKSRLWDACANSYLTMKQVEERAVEFMEPYKGEEMCGSTISFDRSFLHNQMPILENQFHYRNLDVTAFRVLFGKLGLLTPTKREAHRSLADCRESVDNLKFYMQELGLKREDSVG